MREWLLVAVLGCGRVGFAERPIDATLTPDAAGDAGVPQKLYATTSNQLYTIAPDQHYVATKVMDTCTNVPGAALGDLAIDGNANFVSADQNTSVLYILRLDGTCTTIALSMSVHLLGLTSHGGVLYGAADDQNLYQVSTSGALTLVGSMGAPISGDIVFLDSGTLIGTFRTTGSDVLSRIDPATGAATAIGTIVLPKVFGLAELGGAVFGFTDNGTIAMLDPATGGASNFGGQALQFTGAAVGP